MKTMNIVALAFIIIGGLNWGLIGLFNYNIVAALFGPASVLTHIVYIAVGLAAVYALYLFKPVTEAPRGIRHAS